ncbi:phospholipase, partial [Vibrio agarivorans]
NFSEYLLMLATLDVDPPQYLGHVEATFDPRINPYAEARFSGGESIEYLDYVLVSARHRRAIENSNTVKLRQRANAGTWGNWHLSDHFSVEGRFSFEPN